MRGCGGGVGGVGCVCVLLDTCQVMSSSLSPPVSVLFFSHFVSSLRRFPSVCVCVVSPLRVSACVCVHLCVCESPCVWM